MRDRRAAWTLAVAMLLSGCLARRPSPVSSVTGPAAVEPAAGSRRRSAQTLERVREADLGDLVLFWQARDAREAGEGDGVLAAARALARGYPDSVWRGDVYLLAGLVARQRQDFPAARRWLADALPELDEASAAWRRAMVVLAEVTARLGDEPTALRLARSLRAKHPRGIADRRARRLTDRILADRPILLGGSEERLEEAALRLREGDPRWAWRMADELAVRRDSLGARALLLRARAEWALGQRADAEATSELLAATASPEQGAEALLQVGRWHWNADDDRVAARFFERARTLDPQGPSGMEATYALARIAQEEARWDAAATSYARATAAADPAIARGARWGAAWVRYLGGDYRRAATAFATLAARGDADALAARYWNARALERAGDARAGASLGSLAEQHPDTYYGWMAARRLGWTGAAAASVVPPPRPPFPDALTGVHAERARALVSVGLGRLAVRELDALRRSAPPELLAQAYEAVGAPEGAIRLAASLPPDAADRRLLYPLAYWDVVRASASAHGLDPLLVQALIRQESAFAPRAVSPADAYGLMQLLPATAAELAAARGLPAPDRASLTRVDVNVALGTMLLDRLLSRYGGSPVKALAAYNAGEDAVRKWETRHGARDEDEFVELISYRETKRYVKAVLDNYQVYRALYAPSALASSRGSPPKAPFDMMTMTSPGRADPAR